jgi:hypothetical protein
MPRDSLGSVNRRLQAYQFRSNIQLSDQFSKQNFQIGKVLIRRCLQTLALEAIPKSYLSAQEATRSPLY